MKTLKISGVKYTIKFSDDPRTVDPDKDNTAQSLAGCVNYREHTIGLHKNMQKVEVEQTFFHELAHLICSTYHIMAVADDEGKHNEAAMDYFGIGLQEALSSLGINILEHLKDKK